MTGPSGDGGAGRRLRELLLRLLLVVRLAEAAHEVVDAHRRLRPYFCGQLRSSNQLAACQSPP